MAHKRLDSVGDHNRVRQRQTRDSGDEIGGKPVCDRGPTLMPPSDHSALFLPDAANGSRCARSTSGSPSTELVRACRRISRRTACAIPTATSHLIEDGVDPTFVQFILSRGHLRF